jgi:type I restriction enzyme S subunit
MIGWRITGATDYITREAVSRSSTRIVPRGSLLVVTRSGILRSLVPVAVAEADVAINQDLKALLIKGPWSGHLLALLLRSANAKLRQLAMKTGTTVESLDLEAIKRFELLVPTSRGHVDRAQTVLVGAAREIDLLDRQLNCLRAQKCGLMQKLLTGDRRLIDRVLTPQAPLRAVS